MTYEQKATRVGFGVLILWLLIMVLSKTFGFAVPPELSTGLIVIGLAGLSYYTNKRDGNESNQLPKT